MGNILFHIVEFWWLYDGDGEIKNNNIVMYSRVLFTMELYCTPKSQHTTVKHSQQLFEHKYTSKTCMVSEH
jgi:hypothetical protein